MPPLPASPFVPVAWEALGLSWLGLSAIILFRYVAIVWPIHHALWGRPEDRVRARKLARTRPSAAAIRHEVTLSAVSSLIYALPAAWVLEMWKAGGTAMYSGPPEGVLGWLWLPVSAFIYLIVQDTHFYWTHRLFHHRKLFSWAHSGHHKTPQPSPWAAFSFDPVEALSAAWVLPLLACFVPIHLGAAAALLLVMTVTAVLNHAGWEVWPERWLEGPLGRHLITASHHNLHHTRFRGNYGLYFRWWDRLMGTDRGLGVPATRAKAAATAKA